MQKLAAIDANFLYSETDRAQNLISSFQILELPEQTTVENYIAEVERGYMERLHLVPYFYRKVELKVFKKVSSKFRKGEDGLTKPAITA